MNERAMTKNARLRPHITLSAMTIGGFEYACDDVGWQHRCSVGQPCDGSIADGKVRGDGVLAQSDMWPVKYLRGHLRGALWVRAFPGAPGRDVCVLTSQCDAAAVAFLGWWRATGMRGLTNIDPEIVGALSMMPANHPR